MLCNCFESWWKKGLLKTVLIAFLCASGCGARDEFPMHNPTTGQDIVCRSGRYWFDEGLPQARIGAECIHACERYGFKRQTGNPYADAAQPRQPDDDVRPEIPAVCLP